VVYDIRRLKSKGNDTIKILSTQILASKSHSPLKGTRVPGEMVDSMAGTGRLQEEDYVCQKVRSALRKKRHITRTQEPAESALIHQIRDSYKIAIHESIWVMDRGKESSSLADHT